MKQIVKLIMGKKEKEKKFLYFSYIANVLVICILVMIATGIDNITNDSLSKSDLQQVESVLSSVIFVSILAIMFFQWVISMQFGALFDSRSQFNNNMRLMGVPNKQLLKVYIKELFYMQPLSVIVGVLLAEGLYYVLSSIMSIDVHFILLPQVIISLCLHVLVTLVCVLLTYRKRVSVNVIDEMRCHDDRDCSFNFGIGKRIEIVIGLVILAASIVICILGNNEDDRSWGYFGIILAAFILLDILLIFIHRILSGIAKKLRIRSLVLSEFIAVGYLKKNKVVCNMIIFSAMLFLGMQMLYINVRFCGSDVVDNNVHYKDTVWYEEYQTEQISDKCYYGLKFKYDKNGTVYYFYGIDDKFLNEYENIECDKKLSDISDTLSQKLNDKNWNGILIPNYYIQSSDIGKEVTYVIAGKEVTFKVAGGYYNNNLAHFNCLVSKSYLASQLGIDDEYNMLYLKDKMHGADLVNGKGKVVTQSFEEIKAESYEKAVSGTSLVEMVSIVIIACAVFALLNYIMLSSKSSIIDIARLRGIGLLKRQIQKIYIIQSAVPVVVSMLIASPLSILFAKIGCLMVFDEGYYSRDLVMTPLLMLMLLMIFGVISVFMQMLVIRKVTTTNYYINILRDVIE